MKVRGIADFFGAVFEGTVLFIGTDIGSDFFAADAKFQNNGFFGASFGGMKVRGNANFTDAVFEGGASFASIDIATDLFGQKAKFRHSTSFSHMKVRGNADFTDAEFVGSVDFSRADIANDFDGEGAKFGGASFYGMKVGGGTSFHSAVFEGPVDFRYADFGRLDLAADLSPQATAKFRKEYPDTPSQFDMQGMSYKYVGARIGNEPESHKALLTLADQSLYTADVYSNLAEFFSRQGYRADADEAFIAGKCREREEYFHSAQWFRWLGSWMLYLLVGYGRRPWQAGIYCAVLIGLGCVLFSPNNMEPQKPGDAPRVYSRFWYSLGLFLPVVDLRADKVWKPKADQTFLRNYMREHILLGWILVPLVLAALTGLIK